MGIRGVVCLVRNVVVAKKRRFLTMMMIAISILLLGIVQILAVITDIKILKRIETLEYEVFGFPSIFDYDIEER